MQINRHYLKLIKSSVGIVWVSAYVEVHYIYM